MLPDEANSVRLSIRRILGNCRKSLWRGAYYQGILVLSQRTMGILQNSTKDGSVKYLKINGIN